MLSASPAFTRSQLLQLVNKSGWQTVLHLKHSLAQAHAIRKQGGHGPRTSTLWAAARSLLLSCHVHVSVSDYSHASSATCHSSSSSDPVTTIPSSLRFSSYSYSPFRVFVCCRWAYGGDAEAGGCSRPFPLLPPPLHCRLHRHSQPQQSQISRREPPLQGTSTTQSPVDTHAEIRALYHDPNLLLL